MVDKNVSIKSATDQELNGVINRLREERNALQLIKELKIKSTSNPDGSYPNYSIPEGFSTETIVANGKSIKNMTDEELRSFIYRLRNENEAIQIISDIKEMNNPIGPYTTDKPYEGVNLNEAIENMYHSGIMGMRWGIRRDRGSFGRRSTDDDFDRNSTSNDHMKSQILKVKGYKNLSNEELKELTTRMQLERSLRELKSSDYQKGLDVVKTITAAGTTVAALYGLSQTQLGKDLIKAAQKTKKVADAVT